MTCRVAIALFLLSQLPTASGAPPAKKAAPPVENDFYHMISFPLPPEVVLEVGGLDWLDKEQTRLLVCTRRGEVWRIENVYTDAPALAGQRIKKKDGDG